MATLHTINRLDISVNWREQMTGSLTLGDVNCSKLLSCATLVLKKTLLYLFTSWCIILSTNCFGQNVTVNPGAGSYATLQAAFGAINSGTHTGALTLDIIGNTTETGTAVLNASGTGSANYTSILIQPNGGSPRTISGSLALPLIDLNGADQVTIDGLNTGGNSLTISNLSISAVAGTSTLRFIHDASNNIITNCTLLGSSRGVPAQTGIVSSPAAATIIIGASSGATGNDNNLISNCNIGEAGVNLPVIALTSAGQSISISNDNNSIIGNNIYNFYGTSGSNGIAIGSNSSAFTISSNKFYQTTARTGLGNTSYLECIFISTASGGGYTINNNIIGFAASDGTGMFTITGGRFAGIDITAVAEAPASNVQGNTINGISWTNTTNTSFSGVGVFNGIMVKAGGVNVGTTSGNTIGATSGIGTATSNIFMTNAPGLPGHDIYPIFLTSSTPCSIVSNNIGAIGTGGAATLTGYSLSGIIIAGSGSHTVHSNTIGNSTPGGISLGVVGVTTVPSTFVGIDCAASGAITIGASGNGNTIQNISLNAIATSDFFGIRNTGACSTLNINYNTIKGILFGATASSHASRFTGIISTGAVTTSVFINNNSLGVPGTNLVTYALTASSATGALVGISCTSAITATTHSIQNNDIQGIHYTSTGSGAHTYINLTGATATSNLTNISNNTFTNLTINKTGAVNFISHVYIMSPTSTQTFNNNSIVTGFNKTGAGGSVFIFSGASTSSAGHTIITNNHFSNITVTGASLLLGISNSDGSGVGPRRTITGNTFNNWTGGTSDVTGISILRMGPQSIISNNTISNITGQSIITGISINSNSDGGHPVFATNNSIHDLSSSVIGGNVSGINSSNTTTVLNIQGNSIHNLHTVGQSSTVTGIAASGGGTTNMYENTIHTLSRSGGESQSPFCNGISASGFGGTFNIYKNKIYDLLESAPIFTSSGAVNGILLSGGQVTTFTVYNNLIGDLRAPAANLPDAIRGISIPNLNNFCTYHVYSNTVHLNASSTGLNFGTSGIYHVSSATPTDDPCTLRNNIVVNVSTANGSGRTVAFRRSSAALNNYSSASNNNLFYAGTTASPNFIYYDGTTGSQLPAFKALVLPRDAASVTENPVFLSTSGSNADFLHINASIPTQIESAAVAISGITNDYDGNTRNPSTPDIGADEGAFIINDITAPSISYSPLTTSSCPQGILAVAIVDALGVNIAPGTRPRLYYRKTTHANAFIDNTPATNGWKYVESSNTTSPFNFAADYSLLFGGGISVGDMVTYFIVAQDIAGTPSIGINTGIFTTAPTSVALVAGNFPVTTTNTYNIVQAGLSGTISLGASESYHSLTEAGAFGLFQAINTVGLSGNLIVNIVDASITETGTVSLNAMSYHGCNPGPYSVTIKPSTGVSPVLSGSNAAALINLNGADYVIIDGSNNGTSSKDLTISNTHTSGATIRFINAAANNVVKNSVLTGVSTSTSNAIVFFSSSPFLPSVPISPGNDFNIILNNDIRSGATTAVYGILNSNSATFNTGQQIIGNKIFNFSNTGIRDSGGSLGTFYSGNEIYSTATQSTNLTGFQVASGSGSIWGFIFTGNKIYDLLTTGSVVTGINLGSASHAAYAGEVSNNFIALAAANPISLRGIYIQSTTAQFYHIYYNTVNISGSVSGASNSEAFYRNTAGTNTIVNNNVLVNTRSGGTGKHYVIRTETPLAPFTSDYNDIYAGTGTGNVFGRDGATDRIDLAAWQAATSRDLNSVSIQPIFISPTDLHLVPASNTSLDNLGTPISGITVDIDNGQRDISNPDMGADEFSSPSCVPIVTNTNDSGAGSLRDIISCASAGATVTFSLAPMSQILLTTGEIPITKNLIIAGTGIADLTISGEGLSRIFNVNSGKTLEIQNLSLKNGYSAMNGGAVYVEGSLLLENILLENNFQGVTSKSLTVVSPGILNINGTVDIKF